MPNAHTIGSTLITRLLESYYFRELGVKFFGYFVLFYGPDVCVYVWGRKGQELQLPFFLQIICVNIMCKKKKKPIC
jgi:hypothetical protein